MRNLGVLTATCGPVGYVPLAPGTAGSMAGLALYGLVRLGGDARVEFGLCAMVLAAGVWASSVAERRFRTADPGAVVIDEVAGMLITLLGLHVTWGGALAGLLAFRFFDVVKLFPARAAERLPGGWGVMADDVVAGIQAHLVVRFLSWAWAPVTVS